MIDRCETCAFYRPHDGGKLGTCRISPPAAVLREDGDDARPWLDGQWPVIFPSDYCGEYADCPDDTDTDEDTVATPNRWAIPLSVGVIVGMLGRRRG